MKYDMVCRESEESYWDRPNTSYDRETYETKRKQYIALSRKVAVKMDMPDCDMPAALVARYGSSRACLDALAASDKVSIQNGVLRAAVNAGKSQADCQAIVDKYSYKPGRENQSDEQKALKIASSFKGSPAVLMAALQAQMDLLAAQQRAEDAKNLEVLPDTEE